MRTTIAVLVALMVAVAVNQVSAAESNLCTARKADFPRNRPIRFPKNCLSVQGQYKCGVFYKDLPRLTDKTKTKPLSWIGGLPDALRKEAVKSNPAVRETFGNLKPSNFIYKKNETENFCSETLANSRCYVAMIDPAEFGFYYSACGTPWKAINYVDDKTGVKKNLEGAEKLCCQWKNDKYMFKRCDGNSFKPSSSCS